MKTDTPSPDPRRTAEACAHAGHGTGWVPTGLDTFESNQEGWLTTAGCINGLIPSYVPCGCQLDDVCTHARRNTPAEIERCGQAQMRSPSSG